MIVQDLVKKIGWQNNVCTFTLTKKSVMNYYIDINGNDRSQEIENQFSPTLEDIKNDPEFYAELVNDLMFHWMYGTRETPLMVMAKRNHKIGVEGKVI